MTAIPSATRIALLDISKISINRCSGVRLPRQRLYHFQYDCDSHIEFSVLYCEIHLEEMKQKTPVQYETFDSLQGSAS